MDRTARTQVKEPEESTLRAARSLGADKGFADRVRVAAVAAAVAVSTESAKTPNGAARAMLARQVLMNPERWGRLMAEAVAVNPTIAGKQAVGEPIPDGDIEFTVSSLWDAYAGSTETSDE